MNRVRFLGEGLPPRSIPCANCGEPLRIDEIVFTTTGTPSLFCAPQCYAAKHPHDPDVADVRPRKVTKPAAARPADVDEQPW